MIDICGSVHSRWISLCDLTTISLTQLWTAYKDKCNILQLKLAQPMTITRVDVYETYYPGSLTSIECITGTTHLTLWTSDVIPSLTSSRIFSPTLVA